MELPAEKDGATPRRGNISIDRGDKFLLYKIEFHFGDGRMFHIADPKDIKDGKMTDIYFVRTMQVLKAKKIDKWVKTEFIAKRFPEEYGWGVLAGIEEAADLLKDLKVSDRAMKEGTLFRAYNPLELMRILDSGDIRCSRNMTNFFLLFKTFKGFHEGTE